LQFKGITILTPNEPEVEFALQVELDDDQKIVNKAGRMLLGRAGAEAVLITRGAKGMVLFEKQKPALRIPIYGSSDIVDVTGAGDTVISVLTLALACGASFREAAVLANYAAGIVVMKKGTATVSPRELKEAILSEH
jgi:rfaE bifunctional protein kinase chain/domain